MSELPHGTGFVYLGCYTEASGGEGAGITLARRDPAGALRDATLVARTPSPSFLVKHPLLPVLYAVNEVRDGELSAFAISPDGGLTALGSWSTAGMSPCHVSVGDGHVFVANYGSGSVAVFAIDDAGVPTERSDTVAHSGRGPDAQRQEGPHAHMVYPVEGGVLAVDLGVDAVYSYSVDARTGRLGPRQTVTSFTPGTGPRHLVRDRAGRVHVLGELDAVVVSFDVREALTWNEISRLPATRRAGMSQPSHIDVSPDGRFLYAGNRGVDTVAVFSLSSGPQWVGEVSSGGAWPRHFALLDDLLYVANERSHQVTVFRCDPVTGLPVPTGAVLHTPSPTCVVPVP